jgi:hypothetical protein
MKKLSAGKTRTQSTFLFDNVNDLIMQTKHVLSVVGKAEKLFGLPVKRVQSFSRLVHFCRNYNKTIVVFIIF